MQMRKCAKEPVKQRVFGRGRVFTGTLPGSVIICEPLSREHFSRVRVSYLHSINVETKIKDGKIQIFKLAVFYRTNFQN